MKGEKNMSKSKSGLFHGTKGNPSPGSVNLMDENDNFMKYISNSSDIDVEGRIDVIGHGRSNSIEWAINGKNYSLNHRELAKMVKSKEKIKGKIIRLLSCDTGADENGFAQNLANKLNIVVEAPTKLVWAYPNGKYIVASRSKTNPKVPDLNCLGRFKRFYPGGNKKWKK